MRRRPFSAFVVLLVIAAAAPTVAPAAAGDPPWSHRVVVGVPWHPSPKSPVRIAFHPLVAVPHHGYYYAVAVLEHYRHRGEGRPACAVSSNMDKTQYGQGGRDGRVRLALLAAVSAAGHWCAGGLYEGAVYAVPHRPPCTRAYPCYGHSSCGPGGHVCGVIPRPTYEYSYPTGLPKPLDRSTRVIGRFTIHFGAPE